MPRIRATVRGVVQGVGFRPFVLRIARARGLVGWVQNQPDGVRLEAAGPRADLDAFVLALRAERPAPARVDAVLIEDVADAPGEVTFSILESAAGTTPRPAIPADLATCEDCAREVATPGERRHRYPFTNCTYCGPRYSIVRALPYDRPRTSMSGFPLCPACRAEYDEPLDRRFHAQPIACPSCGPRLALRTPEGKLLAERDDALAGAARAIAQGKVVAMKGVGGYQLLVDATREDAVALLRRRKHREEKPFAVMFPSLGSLERACEVDAATRDALTSPAAPIVLLARRDAHAEIAGGVAPGNPQLGALLPYSPLHALLLGEVDRPVVCTSGNLSDEPMCTDEGEAHERLASIADVFLDHDRPIVRPVDDSVVRVGARGPVVLRRARGYAPLAFPVALAAPPTLALGAHQKSTVALLFDRQAVVSQHLGDLESHEGALLLERTVSDLTSFFEVRPERLACDLHPDYASTRLAERLAAEWKVPLVRVQHHHAHVAAAIAEHAIDGPVLGLAWDGSGFGTDGSVWGGEALLVDGPGFERAAHLRTFRLPGGERAVREPRRAALGLLFEALGPERAHSLGRDWFSPGELGPLLGMLERGTHAPRTSSIGRLFDAVAAIAGVRARAGFEGQAAMELEFAARTVSDDGAYPFPLLPGTPIVADFAPLVVSVLEDRARGASAAVVAARLQRSLVDLTGSICAAIAARAGVRKVVLTGGCFQNAFLSCAVPARLEREGFAVYAPTMFPPNDGGISLGQAYVAASSRPMR